MKEIKGEKLHVALGASQVRRRLKGHGFGVRKVYTDGKNRAVIIHTATGEHLQELEAFFQDVLTTPLDSPLPHPNEDG
jgi:DNA transformation protein and related proteins